MLLALWFSLSLGFGCAVLWTTSDVTSDRDRRVIGCTHAGCCDAADEEANEEEKVEAEEEMQEAEAREGAEVEDWL